MKNLIPFMLAVVVLAGCSRQVDFVYFNRSGHEITVDDVSGLPGWASPGVLVASTDTNRPSEASATCFESVRIADQISIHWTESGKTQELRLQRADLGVPATLREGRLCFTYLGDRKWRAELR
jgi:hypothetical protein